MAGYLHFEDGNTVKESLRAGGVGCRAGCYMHDGVRTFQGSKEVEKVLSVDLYTLQWQSIDSCRSCTILSTVKRFSVESQHI